MVKDHLVMVMQGLNFWVPLHTGPFCRVVELAASARAFVDSIRALLCCASLGTQSQQSLIVERGVR